MIGCEVASTKRPRKGVATGSAQSESSAPTATTSCSFFRRFGRSFRTLCSSRPTSTPWCCTRQHGLIRAIFWSHRVSDCSSTTIFSTRFPHFAAAIRPPRFWLRKQRFKGADGPPCTWNEPALLFEVGLSSLFQFPPATHRRQAKPDEAPCEPLGKRRSNRTHRRCFRKPGRGYPVAIAAAIIALGLGVTASCRFLRRKTWSLLNPLLEGPASRIGLISRAAGLYSSVSVCSLSGSPGPSRAVGSRWRNG